MIWTMVRSVVLIFLSDPWSRILSGSYFYFSYRYMLNVLEEIPDLKEIELHLHIFANGREEEEELRKQTELLPRVAELIATVLRTVIVAYNA